MEFNDVTSWASKHPYATGGIVFGVGLVLLWWFGFFSSSSGGAAGASSGDTNMAAAYYGAEAAQLTAGTQLQLATVQAGAATAQTQLQADAAVKIQNSQDTTAAAIAATQFGSASTINGQNTAAAEAIAHTNANAAVDMQHTTAADNLKAIMAQITGNVSIAGINADVAKTGIFGQTTIAQIQGTTATKEAEFTADTNMYASGAAAYANTFSQAVAGQLTAIQKAAAGINQ